MAKKGEIRHLRGDEPIWFEEKGEIVKEDLISENSTLVMAGEKDGTQSTKPISRIVRAFIFQLIPGCKDDVLVVDVFNYGDETGDRPPGHGMPGGEIEAGETPFEAFRDHEGGEIIWPIAGIPSHLHTEVKEYDNRVEETYLFNVGVDWNANIPITEGEGREVSHPRLISLRKLIAMNGIDPAKKNLVDTRHGAPEESDPEKAGIYFSQWYFYVLSARAARFAGLIPQTVMI